MKFLIIGYGSIGKRHARNLISSGHNVILLRHSEKNLNKEGFREYYSFDKAIEREERFHGAVVCSPTSEHLSNVKLLLIHNIPFLLEKPPAIDLESTLIMEKMITDKRFATYDIAFNMRCYPILQAIKAFLPNLGNIYSARVYAGHYLPEWRKHIDYRETSSAKKELGGGVHIELVHEIDYILWFFGIPEKVTAYINKISNLEISTEDICSGILKYEEGFIVELHLNYLSHKRMRGCQIIAENGTLEWDVKDARILYYEKNKNAPHEIFALSPDYDFNRTYLEETEYFIEVIKGNRKSRVDINAGVNIMRVVEAIKMSSEKEKWINLNEIETCLGT